MKYLINFLAIVFVSWPALVVGYAFEAAKDGFKIGRNICKKHGDDLLERFRDL